MVRMLSLTENLHTILRVLYDDMMVLCYPMSQVAMAIAGIGALLYIAYRVWQSLAQAEPIDLFPLMRPFAIGTTTGTTASMSFMTTNAPSTLPKRRMHSEHILHYANWICKEVSAT